MFADARPIPHAETTRTVNQLEHEDYFSDTYSRARKRFCDAASRIEAELLSYPIDDLGNLAIDVAVIPPRTGAAAIVISSGVHGVEGPLGSALQLKLLEQIAMNRWRSGIGLILIHAVNPYGFEHHRRWNEDNVDLNRNFIDVAEAYSGAPDAYHQIHALLNPETPPSRWEPFRLKAAVPIFRHGLHAIKEAIAAGQYEYPRGLFFGGSKPSASVDLFQSLYVSWLRDANSVVHLDIHTGLGRFAEYRVLLESSVKSSEAAWFQETFDREMVEVAETSGTSYRARGTLGEWARSQLSDRDFRFATVDFGTYSLVRVLSALRAENRAYHYAHGDPRYNWAIRELRECFSPSSVSWRRRVLASGLEIVETAASAMKESGSFVPNEVGNRRLRD